MIRILHYKFDAAARCPLVELFLAHFRNCLPRNQHRIPRRRNGEIRWAQLKLKTEGILDISKYYYINSKYRVSLLLCSYSYLSKIFFCSSSRTLCALGCRDAIGKAFFMELGSKFPIFLAPLDVFSAIFVRLVLLFFVSVFVFCLNSVTPSSMAFVSLNRYTFPSRM